jgi:hypothetical protein
MEPGRSEKEGEMRFVLVAIIVLHGLIHLMGFAKAFRFAELPDLKLSISKRAGVLWLLGAVALTTAGALLLLRSSAWWWVGAPAVVLSQLLIVLAWRDAKFGTLANLIILVPLIAAGLEARPTSYRNRYKAAVREGVARLGVMPAVTEADLARLPQPVAEYLRYAGVVGRPRVQSFRAVLSGEFRNGPTSRWMPLHAEQYDFFDEPTRVFLMRVSMFGLPMEGLHLFRGADATMQIKVASLLQVVDARGPQMNQAETVTLFNDMCLLAPATLIDKERVQWEASGPLEARARFTNHGITIGAQLFFNEAHQLVDFISTDRFFSRDGKSFASYPWSTPARDYRDIDGRRLIGFADAVWNTPEGKWSYGRFKVVEIEYNPKS